jgi:hypothetical protein
MDWDLSPDFEYDKEEKQIWKDLLGSRAPGNQMAGQTVVIMEDLERPNNIMRVFTIVIVADNVAAPFDEVIFSMN